MVLNATLLNHIAMPFKIGVGIVLIYKQATKNNKT